MSTSSELPHKTCDACRKRKTKCSATSGNSDGTREACANCNRLGLSCTFDYVHKRGGRPLGSRDKSARKRAKRGNSQTDNTQEPSSPEAITSASASASHGDIPYTGPSSSTLTLPLPHQQVPLFDTENHFPTDPELYLGDQSSSLYNDVIPPGNMSIATSHNHITYDTHPLKHTLPPLPPPPSQIPMSAPHLLPNHHHTTADQSSAPIHTNSVFSPASASDLGSGSRSAQVMTDEGTSSGKYGTSQSQWTFPSSANANRLPKASEHFYRALRPPELSIEDVTDWSTITFFASLYLKYNHALSPIVHKPTFAHDLATRRDKTDRQFRSLLLGLVTYTIGQSPISRMEKDYTRRELEIIQDRCHKASLLLHDHTYRAPELNSVGTLIYAYFYCQCNSDFTRASIMLASACELAQVMKLDDTSISGNLAQDFRDQELRKRIYWYLYAIDITSACSGLPVHMIPSTGASSFPLEVDDELITTQGAFPQPPGKVSTMTGFVAMVRLHIITGEALIRRRFPQACSPMLSPRELTAVTQWLATAENEVDNIQANLPYQLAPVQAWQSTKTDEERSLYGMQRANILITALAAKFVLYDFKQDLMPNDLATIERRDTVAREGVKTITSIPQDDLASNGESMRGKVFRILLGLMSRSISEGLWGRTLQEWWDLYMNIQFVSIASADITSVLPSRDTTPNPQSQ